MPSKQQHKDLIEIDIQELSELLERSEVRRTLDLGSTILHVAEHVQHGPILLTSTVCGRAAILPL